MKLPISKRLLACAAFVEPGQRVADVGTDHGYLAIYLLQSRRASRVLAADVAEQPLARARENARRFGVREGLSFHLCDGVRGLPGTLTCSSWPVWGRKPWLAFSGAALASGEGTVWCSSVSPPKMSCGSTCRNTAGKSPGRSRCGMGNFYIPSWRPSRAAKALPPGQHFASPALLASGSPLVGEYLAFCRQAVEKVVLGLTGLGGPKYEYYSAALKELREMEAMR